MKAKSLKRGFTLIEVLVVVAILLTLAGLIFMMVGKGKSAAKSSTVLNTLREIGAASAMWMNDNNGFYPPAWDNNGGANRSYAQVLDPYVHGVENFRSTDSKFIGGNARLPVKVNNYSHPITFSMNRAVCRDITSYGDVGEDLIHGTQVERPSEIILLADGCQNPRNLNQANATAYRIFSQVGESGPLGEYDDPIPVGPDVDTPNGDGWFRYPDGTCHAVFCDGSARAFRKGTILKRNIWIDVVRESAEGS